MTTTPSRRSVLRAAAWSAPAVAVVAAAPAHAASVGAAGYEFTWSRPYDGGARIGVQNLSATTGIIVTLTVDRVTATARTGSWGYTPGLIGPGGSTADALVYRATLGPGQSSGNAIQGHWTLVSGDGALQVVGTAAGLAPVVLSLPWRAAPPV